MDVSQSPAEFQRGRRALKQCGQLLNGRQRGKIVSGGEFPLPVFERQFLDAGVCQVAFAGVNRAGKIMGSRRQFEDAGACCIREAELGLVGLVILRVWRDLPGTLVAGASIGLERKGIMVRIGAGKIQREGNGGGLGGANRENPKQGDTPGENGPRITVEAQSRSRAIRFFRFGPDC